MTWLGLIQALLTAVSALAAALGNRRLIDAGAAQAVAAHLAAALDEIGRADAVRDSVRRDLEREPERLRDDDGFKRK